MREEIFGPVAGIMKVSDDEEAVRLMNDSAFGLTAAVWTRDAEAAASPSAIACETGTWFMNRCDYLDPALAWVGVKDSGRGCTLSRVGYEHLTRPKSFHLRTVALSITMELRGQLELSHLDPLRRRAHPRAAGRCALQLGMQRPLLVTDAALATLPMVTDAVHACLRRARRVRCIRTSRPIRSRTM